jgi:hypothetical protein
MTALRRSVADSCLLGAWLFACSGIASCAADTNDDPTAAIRFTATVPPPNRSGPVFVDIESSIDLYSPKCEPAFEFKSWSGSQWIPLQDDRPPTDTGPGYYLNGTFTHKVPGTICEDRTCVPDSIFKSTNAPIDTFVMIPFPVEYVQVGTQRPPGEPASDEVPAIETRTVSGRVELTYFYFTDDTCASPRLEISTEVMFPAQ